VIGGGGEECSASWGAARGRLAIRRVLRVLGVEAVEIIKLKYTQTKTKKLQRKPYTIKMWGAGAGPGDIRWSGGGR